MTVLQDGRAIRAEQDIDLRDRPPSHEPPPGQSAHQRVDPIKVVVFPIRAFLGLGWLRAAVEKLIDLDWWTGQALRDFLIEQRADALPFMQAPTDLVFRPLAGQIAFVVMVLQFMIGAAFITGRRLCEAIWVGIMLNTTFVLMGAVDPSAFYLVMQVSLLAALGCATQASTRPRTRLARLVGCGAVALAMAPFVSTLHPAEVIHDPALMIITIAALAASVEAIRLSGVERRL